MKTSTNTADANRVGSTGGSALLLQIDALIAELMNHNKYPSADAYVMASKLRRTLLGQPDAPSPNTTVSNTGANTKT